MTSVSVKKIFAREMTTATIFLKKQINKQKKHKNLGAPETEVAEIVLQVIAKVLPSR